MSEGLPESMLAALREEPVPVDDLTRARWWGKLAPQLDAIVEARRPRARPRMWLAVAASAAVALVVLAFWPRGDGEVMLERARLHPYMVSGATAEGAAPTLLAGRFAVLEARGGEVVRTELDTDRLAAIGPARIEVAAVTSARAELLATGDVLVDARAPRPLVVHAGIWTVRAEHAVFAVSARGPAAAIYIERGEVDLAGLALPPGAWFGVPALRSPTLVTALRDHARSLSPSDGEILAFTGDAPVVTAAGEVVGVAPLWVRASAGTRVVQADPRGPAAPTVATAQPVKVDAPGPAKPAAPASGPHRATHAGAISGQTQVAPAPIQRDVVPSAAPEDASGLYARAEAELARGDRDAAQATWRELIARFTDAPQVASARYDLARLARDRGDLGQAREQLARLLAASPPPALAEPASYLACRIEIERGEAEAAARCFTAFRGQFPRSPHDAEVLAWLVGHARTSNGCAAARALAEEYARRYPAGPFAARARECIP
jgi:TolA-binding protein